MREKKKTGKMEKRYRLIDTLRGLALISMIVYHGAWNMVYLYGRDWAWYESTGAFYWQQVTCQTFLFLSGFCCFMGRRQLRNGLTIFGSGLLVTVATLLLMPQNRIVFGVLTCIGSCILLALLLKRELSILPCGKGMVVSFLLFCLTYRINEGKLAIGSLRLARLPQEWYRKTGAKGLVLTWLGFPSEGFYSTDYFSLFPWFFLFLTGIFTYLLMRKKGWMGRKIWDWGIWGVEALGRNSLFIYLVHQPILYLIGSILYG